jgi:beta-lactamase class A
VSLSDSASPEDPRSLASPGSLERESRSLALLSEHFDGELAVLACSSKSGETLALLPDRVLPTASVIKIAVLAAAWRAVESGRCRLEDQIPLSRGDIVAGSGILKILRPGLSLSFADYLTLMIAVSDNTATNIVIDRLGGVEPVNRLLHDELGLGSITLFRKVSEGVEEQTDLAVASPRDLVGLLGHLVDGNLVSADASAAMLALLRCQQHLDQVPRLLDYEPLEAELGTAQRLIVANKTGWDGAVRCDAGVIEMTDTTVIYAVMSRSATDSRLALDNEAALVNALVGRLIVSRFWHGPGDAPLWPIPTASWLALTADPDRSALLA